MTVERSPSAAPMRALAAAYSYIRFSFTEQGRGDSVRRQTEAAQAWCDRNKARLDSSTTLHDLGKSAFRGAHRQNPDRNALAAFLKMVEEGKIAHGSFLIIESLDRLTREHIRPALTLLLNLIEAGVRIVQLKPVEVIYDEDVEPMQLMMALMELSRGNSESRIKSERIGAAHASKREQARNGRVLSRTKRTHTRSGKLLTRNLPAWVRIESIERDRYTVALIPERAEVVGRIFALAASGLGLQRIVAKLTEDGVPAWGRLLTDEDLARYEERRRADGEPPLTKDERAALRRPGYWHRGKWTPPAWNRGYVHQMLTDRRALGEYLPRQRAGRQTLERWLASGSVISNYFPPVVDEATFTAARAAMTERKPREGRRVGKHIDLFSRLIYDALDGSVCYTTTRTENFAPRYYDADGKRRRKAGGRGRRRWRLLINSSAGEGRGKARTFPAGTFERAVLKMLREVDPREVLGEASPAAEVAALERQLGWLADRQAELAAELRDGDIPAIAQQLRELKAEQDDVAVKLDEAKQLEAKPLAETWKDLAALLDETGDPDARRRLRAAIARVVDDIQLLAVRRSRDQLAAVQVNFAGGQARRNYLIIHRPPLWLAGRGTRPGHWWAGSIKHPDDSLPFNDFDLRNRGEAGQSKGRVKRYKGGEAPFEGVDEVAAMEAFLSSYDTDLIDRLLAGPHAHPVP